MTRAKGPPKVQARTPQEVIDAALKENEGWGRLLFCFAIAFVLAGLTCIVVALCWGQYAAAALGTIPALLFYPAVALATRHRNINIALRTLEIDLSKDDDPKQALEELKVFRQYLLGSNQKDGNAPGSP